MRTLAFICSASFLVSIFATAACSSDAGLDGPNGAKGGRTSTLSGELCEASPAPAVFGNALCLCGDFKDIGNLIIKKGTGSNLGSVGVNGESRVVSNSQVDGSWGSGKGFSAVGNVKVGGSLFTPADLKVTGNVDVGEKLEVGGSLSGIGRLAVKGEMGVGGSGSVLGYQDIAARGKYQALAQQPCSCEGSSGYLDVAGEVAKAKSKNDNGSTINLGGDQTSIGYMPLTLKSGRYYLGQLSTIGYSKITVTGAVSVFIDGNIDQVGAEVFDIQNGATLDLYVSGVIRQVGYLKLGDKKNPGALRLYMGGGDDVSLNIGDQVFYGTVYAPKANIKYIGNTILEGGLFANHVIGIGNLEVHGARPLPPAGCPGNDSGGSTGGSSSSSGATTSSSSSGGATSSTSSSGAGGSSGIGGSSTTNDVPPARGDGVGTIQIK